MKRLLLFNILLCCATTLAWSEAVVFEYKGPDGNTLKYILASENDSFVMVGPPSCTVDKNGLYSANRDYDNPKFYNYESIIIPEQVIYKGKSYIVSGIQESCFSEHSNKKKPKVTLKKIVIPKSIKTIKRYAFNCCILHEVHITDLAAWCNIEFESGYDNPINRPTHLSRDYYPRFYLNNTPITKLTIPDGVTTIKKYTFSGYRELEEVSISNTVKVIEDEAFCECENLRRVSIPSSVTSIGSSAFEGCLSLSDILLPPYLTSIQKLTFSRCPITEIDIPASVKKIEEKAFDSCWSLKSVVFQSPDITIEGYAFDPSQNVSIKGLSESSNVDSHAFGYHYNEYKKTSFFYFFSSKLKNNIEQWQKKSEFETIEQWRNRVNESTRDKKVKELLAQYRVEFIAKQAKSESKPYILNYDADKEVFPIQTSSEVIYVKVPQSEAQQFKAEFKPEYIHTDYDIVNDRIAAVGRTCKVGDKVYQMTNQYAKADNLDYLALNLPPLEMDFGGGASTTATQPKAPTDLTIDKNIPVSGTTNSNTFAVIIGNENYSLVAKVPYAKNDAQVLAEYCRKTLGLPAKNVRTYGDATYAMMMTAVKDIQDIAKAYNGNINVVFYYAGHGIPDEQDKGAYLLPVDADGRQTNVCYPVSKLYQELGSMNVNSVVVLMDACFSGALRGDGMLVSARAVALKPKPEAPQGKMVVLTAASGDETAYPYEEKGHGMFTYFLLKKLRDTKGNCTLGELSDYIQSNVKQQSVVVNRKSQTPTISSSASIADSWKSMKLK